MSDQNDAAIKRVLDMIAAIRRSAQNGQSDAARDKADVGRQTNKALSQKMEPKK